MWGDESADGKIFMESDIFAVGGIDGAQEAPLRCMKKARFDNFCGDINIDVSFSHDGNHGVEGASV